jgi:hypothetical protein
VEMGLSSSSSIVGGALRYTRSSLGMLVFPCFGRFYEVFAGERLN